MNLVRHEIKIQIPDFLVSPISDFLNLYCVLDSYSAKASDGYYVINSLYLDNDNMLLLERKRQDVARRYSIRIRSYGFEPKFPAFMEIKNKADRFVHKQRAAINSWDTVNFIRDGVCDPGNKDIKHPYIRDACFKLLRLGLKPKIMTQYRRKAYFGINEPYTRVTFDRELKCYPETEYNIFPDQSKFRNYDHFQQFLTSNDNVVLELKCDFKVPSWFFDLINIFELKHTHFSKFDSSYTFLEEADVPDFEQIPVF
jgi:SPX domain protein involved in polyphosphate accumulation